MNSLFSPCLLALAVTLLVAATPAEANGFQGRGRGRIRQRLAKLQERGMTVEVYRDQESGLRVALITNPETGGQRMVGGSREGGRFMAVRQDGESEWEFRRGGEGMEIPDLSSMERVEIPAGGSAPVDADPEAGVPDQPEEVTVPATE